MIKPSEVVLDDVVVIETGDKIVADGIVVGQGTIEADESLLTGESDPVRKPPGTEANSGSYCVSGTTASRSLNSVVGRVPRRDCRFSSQLPPGGPDRPRPSGPARVEPPSDGRTREESCGCCRS
ncbi:MAG: hypothetical protein GY708_23695 [Actinomycetia bacterium]|nr:hypothetical protein [Actinomycetes bacterium]MCP5031926.1 hypothetical protein [Actinomycetes bacterium]